MKYSIVIPAYNEGAVLEEFITDFLRLLPTSASEHLLEILIVENGSTDDTLQAAERLATRHPLLIRVLSNERASYGAAIKRGMLEARGDVLSILECDALDTDFVSRSLECFRNGGARLIVASKRHPQSADNRPRLRRILTAWYNRILRLALGYPGSDTHGHKTIETGLARTLCDLSETSDESLQTEIVLIAWRLGENIVELPLTIAETRQPGFSLLRRLPKVLRSMGELRRSLRRFEGSGEPVGEVLRAPCS